MKKANLLKVIGRPGLFCLTESKNILAYYRVLKSSKKDTYNVIGYYRIPYDKTSPVTSYAYYLKEDEYFYETFAFPVELNGSTLEERLVEQITKSVRHILKEEIEVTMI